MAKPNDKEQTKIRIPQKEYEELEQLGKKLGLTVDALATSAVSEFLAEYCMEIQVDTETYGRLKKYAEKHGLTVDAYVNKLVSTNDLSQIALK
jgi:hypothetical protein